MMRGSQALDVPVQLEGREWKAWIGRAYISNVEVPGVAQSASLGVGEAKSLDDAMVGQSFFLGCWDTCVREVVPCKNRNNTVMQLCEN